MDFDRHELYDSILNANVDAYEEASYRRKLKTGILFLYSTIATYAISLFSMYWFIWKPAINEEGRRAFQHSPTLFFMVIWLLCTAIPILISLQNMWKYIQKIKWANKRMVIDIEHAYKLQNDIERGNYSF